MTFIRDDTNVNIMNITLVSNGIPIDITGCTVELRFKKSDKTTVLGMAEIVNALTGNIKYKLGTNEIASIGNVLVGIMIYGQNGERASSYPFRFSVIADMDDQYDAISSTEYPILTQLISETTEIRNDYLELMNGGGGTDHIHLNMDVLNGLEDDGTGTGILYNGNPIQGSTTTGEDGESAYEIAVRNGFSGTEVEWLASLKGDKGDTGIQGIMPSHQWSGTSLQFQNPDGSWGSLVDLKGQDGTGGSIPSNIILFEDWVIGELVEIDTSGTPDTTAPTVTISPIAGIYGSARTVTMTANESATIYYTLDGSTPTISSTVYSSPLTISSTTTIRYFGRDTAGNSSVVQSATYTIELYRLIM
jgi:hypothetical protein